MRKSLSHKENEKIRKRKSNKFKWDNNRTGYSREMQTALMKLKQRELIEKKKDPFTQHPMSFEEFDNIPDIEDKGTH